MKSCNKLGQYCCLCCKTCYREDHVRRKGFSFTYEKNKPIPCPKCVYETSQTKDLSMSTCSHKFGCQGHAADDDGGGYAASCNGYLEGAVDSDDNKIDSGEESD
ncbi:Zinc finger protein 330 [Blattella germanica]|nr:Zinc finger protein 330 [Blattella germanica]